MRAAIRRLRSLLLSRALALLVVPIGALLPSPAAAYWQFGNVTGASPAQACENWAPQPQDPYLLVAVDVVYFNGVPAERCKFIYKLTGNPSYGYPYQVCPAGEVNNRFATSGCSVVAPPHTNNIGGQELSSGKGAPPCVGNPISPLAGNKYEDVVDLATAGPDVLELRRFYNAFDGAQTSMFGRNWRSNYDRRLIYAGGLRTLTRPNGRLVEFYSTAPYGNSVGMDFRLAAVGSTIEVTDREGTVEVYDDASGRFLSIRKRNGYTQTLTYTNNQLTSVGDSYGRQIKFTYNGRGWVDSATGPDGRQVTYSYRNIWSVESTDLLEKVAYPDETASDPADNPRITYHYENTDFPYALTGITDERGIRYATWQYDANGRATLSEHAGGVDRVTIAFNTNGTVTTTNALAKDTIYSITTLLQTKLASTVQGVASPNCPAANSSYTYTSLGYITSTTDWKGFVTNRSVTATEGLETSRTEAYGTGQARTITTSWDIPKRVPTLISAPRKNTAFTYDTDGLVLTITETDTTAHSVPYSTNGQTRVWTFTYTTTSGVKQLTSVDGPRTGISDVTSYLYTAAGYL